MIFKYHIISLICSFVYISTFSNNTLNAQDFSSITEPIIKGSYQMMRVDEFENIYLINSKNELFRYNNKGQLLFEYSFNSLGTLNELEVSNPQKLLLFFSDFQSIYFFDNTLSEINRLDLEDINLWGISSIALAPDNYIWLFDPVNFRILKIDDTGQQLYSSNETFSGYFSDEFQATIDCSSFYTAVSTHDKYLLFDNFGQFIKAEPLKSNNLKIKSKKILYNIDSKIYIEDLELVRFENNSEEVYKHDKEILDFQLVRNNQLYILDQSGVKKIRLN